MSVTSFMGAAHPIAGVTGGIVGANKQREFAAWVEAKEVRNTQFTDWMERRKEPYGQVDIEIGTMSKAFGVVGGIVAGDKVIIEWLRQRGRPFLFSSAVTAPDAAACLAAVDLLEESTELVDKLWANAKYFKEEMKQLGFDTGVSQTPITPVMLGEAPLAQQFSRELFEEGVFAMAIGFPTVAKGKARIRVMISAAHDTDDLGQGLEAFAKVGRKLGVIS